MEYKALNQEPLWARSHIQKALGDTLHLGGLELTEYLVTQAGIKPDWRVLDVACGTGQSVVHLRRRHGVKAFGCDVLLSQIEHAYNQGLTQRFTPLLVANAHEIPFLCASMDMILCECALSLMQSPIHALQSMHRTLKAGGMLALSDLYLQGEASGQEATSPLPQGSCLTWAAHRLDIERFVNDAGLSIISFEDHSYLLKELAAKLAFVGNHGDYGDNGDKGDNGNNGGATQHSKQMTCSCSAKANHQGKMGYFTLIAKATK